MPSFLHDTAITEILNRIVPSLEWILLLFPILSLYVTWVHWKWWNLYKPSPLIKHLLISSVAVDISATTVAFIAAQALGITKFEIPNAGYSVLLGLAIIIAMSVKVYRRINLRALDHPDVDLEQRVETQNQREDRQFGEERRALEAEHLTGGDETINQRDDRQAGDAKRAGEILEQEAYNDANQK